MNPQADKLASVLQREPSAKSIGALALLTGLDEDGVLAGLSELAELGLIEQRRGAGGLAVFAWAATPADPLTVPAGADFMRSDGETVTAGPVLKAIADGILAAGVLVAPTAGQRVIDAVWNAKQTLDVLEWAGLTVSPTRELTPAERDLFVVGLDGLSPDAEAEPLRAHVVAGRVRIEFP